MASVKKTQRGMEAHRAASASRAMRTGKKMTPVVIKSSGICRSCSSLPIGSVELVSLLLVLVFSLAAVLLTSVLALNSQSQEIADLEAQVQVAQNR
ncbi:MAG: hypothetical protein AAB429_03795 [Patescibacteria group bacterium]